MREASARGQWPGLDIECLTCQFAAEHMVEFPASASRKPMAYEAQIEATKKVIAHYKDCRAAEAKIISGLGSIQRSAQKGKAATEKQRSNLARAHEQSLIADRKAQEAIQSYANNFLE